jgi:prepilin peptidase CpaA
MEWLLPTKILLTLAMAVVVISDVRRYLIPNSINLFILGLYPFAAYFLGLAWPMALVAMAIAFVIGMGIFALGIMGGGDVKLLIVLVLWTGWSMDTPNFLFLTAIFGAVLVVAVLLARWFVAPLWARASKTAELPRILTAKQPVPYGVAIAAAFSYLLWMNQVPG